MVQDDKQKQAQQIKQIEQINKLRFEMAESKVKPVRLKLTGQYIGRLKTVDGVFYADVRLPRGTKHTQVEESKANALIEARCKRLGVVADQCDLVVVGK